MTPDQFVHAQNKLIELVHLRLHGLDPWTRGHFAEALVASLLEGASLAEHGAAPCDLNWDGITIAVRATGSRSTDHDRSGVKPAFAGNWKFPPKQAWNMETHDWDAGEPRRCHADVAVLAFHDGFDIDQDWSFFVLSRMQIEEYPSISITPKSLRRAGFESVEAGDLAVQVKKVAGK